MQYLPVTIHSIMRLEISRIENLFSLEKKKRKRELYAAQLNAIYAVLTSMIDAGVRLDSELPLIEKEEKHGRHTRH